MGIGLSLSLVNTVSTRSFFSDVEQFSNLYAIDDDQIWNPLMLSEITVSIHCNLVLKILHLAWNLVVNFAAPC